MTQLTNTLSPVFPLEKDADVEANAAPLKHSAHIQVFIRLAEPVVFFQGFETQHNDDRLPAVLRGSLVVRVLKATKLKSISLSFKGYTRTEWPEGIPPKKQEFVEINDVVNHTWPFYDSSDPIQTDSRTKTNNSKKDAEYEMLLQGSGASMYKPLPGSSGQSTGVGAAAISAAKLTDLTSPLQLSPVSSNPNVNQLTNNNNISGSHLMTPKKEKSNGNLRRSRANSSGSLNTAKISPSVRSLSPLNLFRRVTSSNHEVQRAPYTSSTTNPNSNSNSANDINNSKRNLSGINLTTSNADSLKPVTSTSIFSELLSSTFSSDATASAPHKLHHRDSVISATSLITSDSFVFQPGDYVYTFEQIIPQTFPESIKADFGFVEYFLLATIERVGAFKSNLNARLPVTIVRTQSDTSVEESEPILISRDWENQLFYDIIISSKDIILDAFLPINFSFSPLDKITLHRIRIYITETMEYYCRGKKIHRLEPTKKFLLAEHCGPTLPNAPKDTNGVKAKYMGNLLEDKDGYLSNKSFEFQVFIPSRFGSHQRLHPDTGFEKIKSNHWIKLCLRLSRMIDGKRKHYEISIDSPIHVLHKLCSHANTLLPSYDVHSVPLGNNIFPSSTSISMASSSLDSKFELDSVSESVKSNSTHNTNDPNHLYHNSNIFFPKEVFSSPILSPNVQPIDVSSMNGPTRTPLPRIVPNRHSSSNGGNNTNNNNRYIHNLTHNQNGRPNTVGGETNKNDIFTNPRLKSNIYQPESIERALTSPQAVPLSPITSPLLRPLSFQLNDSDSFSINENSLDDPPPDFNFDDNKPVTSLGTTRPTLTTYKSNPTIPSKLPPSYGEAIKSKTNERILSSNLQNSRMSRLSLNKSQDSLLFSMSNRKSNLNLDNELENSFVEEKNKEDNDDNDIASSFSFDSSNMQTQNLPSNILRPHSPPTLRPLSGDLIFSGGRPEAANMLPSTLRTDNQFYNDMNQIFSDDTTPPGENPSSPTEAGNSTTHEGSPSRSVHSVNELSPHSSAGNNSTNAYLNRDGIAAEPLLNNGLRNSTSQNRTTGDITEMSYDNSFFQSKDSLNDMSGQPLDSSVDLTALYNRNTVGWNTFQFDEGIDNSHDSRENRDVGGGTDASSRLSEVATQSDLKTIDTDSNADNSTSTYHNVEGTLSS
ncbi:similar to Saccharomyces cerevisiae YJL084C ALY2 Alpha arrestin that controls nutrient-mediated intracellular sorting of permease Gap1p [Maudiozyma saulgeensis]|uniref:Similar to Saccharomyces cerevisiae YJL084C ALY2 Alpha arrestin that controls nutrient-mediated intracellular sorting of permease Gap1p n=1 Tax=Maudiozyma saulgeensis TaxID=1789683 RepID=A0A1X7R8F6_9SACH|nr:similar to Saccharomyces cerevisiae YJL084C ALY2 Alpha arrestin that controls nutrient-mediated intracellular sorting of permease Gap1p [Kazachstania saulgeensis]